MLLPFAMALCVVGLIAFIVQITDSGKVSERAVDEVAGAVLDVTDQTEMIEGDNSVLKRLYGLDPSAYEGVVLYYPNGAGVANELLVIKLASTDQQESVKTAIEARQATEENSFNGYGVGQYEMLQESIIDVSGNYVLFIVSDNPREADAAFQDML